MYLTCFLVLPACSSDIRWVKSFSCYITEKHIVCFSVRLRQLHSRLYKTVRFTVCKMCCIIPNADASWFNSAWTGSIDSAFFVALANVIVSPRRECDGFQYRASCRRVRMCCSPLVCRRGTGARLARIVGFTGDLKSRPRRQTFVRRLFCVVSLQQLHSFGKTQRNIPAVRQTIYRYCMIV